jgi:hypothetical protein
MNVNWHMLLVDGQCPPMRLIDLLSTGNPPRKIQIAGPKVTFEGPGQRGTELASAGQGADGVHTTYAANSVSDVLRYGPIAEAWLRGDLNPVAAEKTRKIFVRIGTGLEISLPCMWHLYKGLLTHLYRPRVQTPEIRRRL